MIAQMEAQILAALQSIFDQFGWVGVAGLMAFENATGITPSEIILGLAGWMLVEAHGAPFSFVFLGGFYAAAGSILGASSTYWLARLGGRPVIDRVSRWFRLDPAHMENAEKLFYRWGPGIVLAGRVVPGVRTLVTIPAGLARMSFLRFFIFTFLGAYLWCTLLIAAGYWLGHEWALISSFMKRYALVALGAAGLSLSLALFLRWFTNHKKKSAEFEIGD